MPVQLHGGDRFPVPGQQLATVKPHRQWQLGGIEFRCRGHGGLAPAVIALQQLAKSQLAVLVMAAVRASESVGPSPLIDSIEALFFGSVVLEELVEAEFVLERYRIVRHE